MARKNSRRNAGLWFLGILGLILTAIGLRYASSSGLWTNVFGPGLEALQTVNTGANVLMSTTSSPSPSPSSSPNSTPPNTLLPDSSSSPSSPSSPPTNGSTSGARMW